MPDDPSEGEGVISRTTRRCQFVTLFSALLENVFDSVKHIFEQGINSVVAKFITV